MDFASHNTTTVAVTSADLHHIILIPPRKSCELDPLSTFLLQEFVDMLLPFLTILSNRSIQDEVLPILALKSDSVLKRSSLDSFNPVNLHPLLMLHFCHK